MSLTLQTPRLVLRDFSAVDFEAFYLTTQDPEYQQFYPVSETSLEFMQVIFERILAKTTAADRQAYQLAVCTHSGDLIGTCGVRMEDLEQGQASFGCAIARGSWGSGLAHEAASALFDFGFCNLPIHRLYAETIAENSRARRLAESLGMHLDGVLRQNRFFRGRWWSTAIYSILKAEWEANHTHR